MIVDHLYSGGPCDGERLQRHAPPSRRLVEQWISFGTAVKHHSRYSTTFDPADSLVVWSYLGDEPKPAHVLQAEVEVPDDA